MDGKNRALQHIAARKPPGTSLKSAKVVHCRNPIEIVKEAVLNHWAEKELLIKAGSISNNSHYSSNAVLDGTMEFSDDIMGEQSNEQPVVAESSKTKRPRKRSQQRKSYQKSRSLPEEDHHLWMRSSHRSPVLSRKGVHFYNIGVCLYLQYIHPFLVSKRDVCIQSAPGQRNWSAYSASWWQCG
jgi:hypothetical protein